MRISVFHPVNDETEKRAIPKCFNAILGSSNLRKVGKNMNNKIRKGTTAVFSAVALCLCMVLGTAPVRVSAANTDMTVTVSGCNAQMIGDIAVDAGGETYHSNPGEASVSVSVSSEKCNIELSLEPGYKLTSATIGATTVNADGAFYNHVRFVNISVASSVSITVTGAGTDSDYANIVWTDDDPGWMGGDCYVDPATGTIQLLKIVRGSGTIWENGSNAGGDHEYLEVSPDTHFVQCKNGDVLTYKFIPSPGYQISGASINGHALTAQSGQSVFEVTANGQFHINGAFTRTDAQTSVSAGGITSMSVSGAENAVTSGNVAVNAVAASNPSDNDLQNAMGGDSADFISAVTTADISMTNIISKGGSGTYFSAPSNYWTNAMTDLSSPVDLSLAVPNNLSGGETYSIVRHHGGTYEELDAVYNTSTGMLTFSTDGFSEYTVIKKAGTPVSTPVSSGSISSSSPAEPEFGYTVGGGSIGSFEELEKVLLGQSTLPEDTHGTGILQVVLRRYEKIIPAGVFSALDASTENSLHVFVGNGTALRFFNDNSISGQSSLDVTCNQTYGKGFKRISFRSDAALKVKCVLHTIVPAGTGKVTVYRVLSDGTREKLCTVTPTPEGRLGFEIIRLGTYELTY